MDIQKNNSYITIPTATGAVIGATYGFRHPGEQTCIKISKLKPTIVETFQNYIDSFNMVEAAKAVGKGNITINEYTNVKDIINNITNVMQKEQLVQDIAHTPLEQRTTSFRQAIKDANAARTKLYKALFKLQSEFKTKLIENNIFNQEKFELAIAEAKKKTITIYKLLSKCALKGLATGTAIGLTVGLVLHKIGKNRSKDLS